ncbi:fatty acid desaturase [Planctomycetaceae bacterium]|nr:fatty acid desaturase [bacterium]MDC0273112.1 fatty acid desaturase [Planctomycetaceae bacterium]
MFGEWRVWSRFIIFPIVAIFGHFAMMYWWADSSPSIKAASIFLLTLSWYCISGCLHEMGHMTLLPNNAHSLWIGRMLGMILVIPFTCFRATHLTHHAKMCTSEDYELWPYCKPKYSVTFRRAFCVFDLLLGTLTAPLIYSRIFWKRNSPLTESESADVKFEYLLSVLFWSAITLIVVYLSMTDLVSSESLSLWWFAPLAFAATMNSLRKLIEHVGISNSDPMFGTRTILPTNPIAKLISFGNFDLNLHGPHHRYGMAKHNELSDKLIEALENQPAARELVFHSYSGAAWHTLRCVLKSPGVGEACLRDLASEEEPKSSA